MTRALHFNSLVSFHLSVNHHPEYLLDESATERKARIELAMSMTMSMKSAVGERETDKENLPSPSPSSGGAAAAMGRPTTRMTQAEIDRAISKEKQIR